VLLIKIKTRGPWKNKNSGLLSINPLLISTAKLKILINVLLNQHFVCPMPGHMGESISRVSENAIRPKSMTTGSPKA